MTKPNGAADAAADIDPTAEDGADASDASQGPATQSADSLPGAAVRGYPGVRAGVPGGSGGLRLYRLADDGVSGAALTPVAYYGLGTNSGPISEDGRWRRTNPEANTYDLNAAKRDLGEARTIANLLGNGVYGKGQAAASIAAKRLPQLGFAGIAKSLGALADPEVGVVAGAVGDFMGNVDVPRLQNKIEDLEAQRKRSGRRPT